MEWGREENRKWQAARKPLLPVQGKRKAQEGREGGDSESKDGLW